MRIRIDGWRSPRAYACSCGIGGGMRSPAQETQINGVHGNAAAGKKQYRRYCVVCHGHAGDGAGRTRMWIDPKPRDFTAAVFKCRSTPTGTLPTDDDLFHAVTRGFVTTNMPSWVPLTQAGPGGSGGLHQNILPALDHPGAGDPDHRSAGVTGHHGKHPARRELFQKMECWKCHGPAGHGDGPSASTLTDSKDNPIRPYNFTSGSRFKCGETNEDLYRIFMTGLDGTPMPSFADNLQPQDAWDLVHFLRTLQPDTPEAAAVAGLAAGARQRAEAHRPDRRWGSE